jgi:HK97 family phage major capsid protein
MKILQQLIAKRQKFQDRVAELMGVMEGDSAKNIEGRSLNDTESAELTQIRTELETLKRDIENAQFMEDQAKERAKNFGPTMIKPENRGDDFEKLKKRFSITRAANGVSLGKLDGIEAEVSSVANRMAAECGIPTRGGVMIPFMGKADVQARALNGISSSMGNVIETENLPMENGYAIQTFAQELGATMHMNLYGIKEIPVVDLLATAAYATETGSLPEIDPSVRNTVLSPKPVIAKLRLTNLQRASSPLSDEVAYRTISAAESYAINQAIVNGNGTTAPLGILPNTDVTNLDLAASGAMTFAQLVKMKNAPGNNNYIFQDGPRGWLTNESVRGQLESLQHGTSGKFVWDIERPDLLAGYKAVTTTLIPNNTGVGTNESGIIFGIWSNLHVANWAFRELVVDNVTTDSETIFKWYSYWNHALTSPKAFSKCRNIIA